MSASETRRNCRGIELDQLVKHMSILGMPGSGKTTAIFHLLLQLFGHDIPFIVFEPAKTEYRTLKTLNKHADKQARGLAQQLRLYTLGAETISPFRFQFRSAAHQA